MTPLLHTETYGVSELTPYINWLYLLHAWQLPPRLAGAVQVHDCPACHARWIGSLPTADHAAGREALRLIADAREMLSWLDSRYHVYGRFGLFAAQGDGDDIVCYTAPQEEVRLPLLRQQTVRHVGDPYLCLADFVSPQRPAADDVRRLPVANVVGVFVTAVEDAMEQAFVGDDYRHMLVRTLAERLAEAAAERLHEAVRRTHWGYAPDEHLDAKSLFAEAYQGRRPAVGYPSLPDQSLIFLMDRLIDFGHIGVHLTENGMMQPAAAVAGLMLGHPAVRHFAVGRISEEALADYARRRGVPADRLRPFLRANLT